MIYAQAAELSAEPLVPPASVEHAEADTMVYGPQFFESHRPDTAYDMVKLVPGFTIDQSPASRGLGDVVGNILIDHQRPAKGVSIIAELERIQASNVAVIRMHRGPSPGIDMAGYSMIVDVIRAASSRTSGSATVSMAAKPHGLTGSIAADVSSGTKFRKSASAALTRDEGALEANRTVSFSNGEASTEKAKTDSREKSIALSPVFSAQLDAQTKLSLTTTWNSLRATTEERRQGNDTQPRQFQSSTQAGTFRSTAELQHSLNFGELTMTASLASGTVRSKASSSNTRFKSDSSTGERASRASLSIPFGRFTVGTGLDYARNELDAKTQLVGPDGPIFIPNSNVSVVERRAGGFLSASLATSQWSGQAQLRADSANMHAGGDFDDSRTMFYLRPRLQLGYELTSRSRLDLSVSRDVEQLPFSLFAATAKLADGTVNAGSNRIDPESKWRTELSLLQGFWSDGSVTLSVAGELIDNPVGLIVTEDGFDATGNLGSARRFTASIASTVPLRRLGVDGGKLDLNASYTRSSVEDPVTGELRRLANERPWTISMQYRHDLKSLPMSFGFSASTSAPIDSYRLAETLHVRTPPAYAAWIEYKPIGQWLLHLEAGYGGDTTTTRRSFNGRRDSASLAFVERSAFMLGPTGSISIKAPF